MKNTKENKKWIIYNLIIAFSYYWAANLLLWFPWSISAYLGITLMLTIAPLLWGYGVYTCLIRYQGEKLITGAILNSIILVTIAIIQDYIFFGLIRGAIKELYDITTFYGYGFLFSLPYIEIFIFKKLINTKKRDIRTIDYIRNLTLGVSCLMILISIIILDIKI